MNVLTWQLARGGVVRPLETADAASMWALIAANRSHLDRWLRWSASVRSLADTRAFIETFAEKRGRGDGFHCGIWDRGALAGGVVVWHVHRENRNAEVGYWLGHDFTGRGLAIQAARAVVTHLFRQVHVHRVEMQCGVDNHRSRAIPERLGFQLEGVRRQSHWITDRFVDHAVYGLLAPEWHDD